jgi:outer membrane protein assembly factor BamB
MPFYYDDDTFFGSHYTQIISNQEDQHTIQVISFPAGKAWWSYGHVNAKGTGPGFLNTPDDAYLLPNGIRTVADAYNCRVLFISPAGRIVRQYGTTGACGHDPPRRLGAPNGDTPLPNGGVLITEITGSWVDAIDANGKLMFAVQAPVRYPSDAQWLGHGKILLADYSRPGHVLVMRTNGTVLWKYGPPSGPGMLDHPSLALPLPNGLIAVNDDYRHRVVLIDPKTNRIVWQYGHTDVAGTAPGYLDTPDGMDFLPFDTAMRSPAIRRVVLKG